MRRPDPRIEGRIHQKLSGLRTILNIGAGTGSYEPKDSFVIGLDPSIVMLQGRPPGAAPCAIGYAESLPFRTSAFDGAMAILTMHHWSAWEKGILETLRVCRHRVVILTWDPDHGGFWLTRDYLKEVGGLDSSRFPSMDDLRKALGDVSIEPLPIPWDCSDGFMGAYWRRPEAYLVESNRKSISSLAMNSSAAGLERLREDLENGEWERKHGFLRKETEMDLGYRLVVLEKAPDRLPISGSAGY